MAESNLPSNFGPSAFLELCVALAVVISHKRSLITVKVCEIEPKIVSRVKVCLPAERVCAVSSGIVIVFPLTTLLGSSEPSSFNV